MRQSGAPWEFVGIPKEYQRIPRVNLGHHLVIPKSHLELTHDPASNHVRTSAKVVAGGIVFDFKMVFTTAKPGNEYAKTNDRCGVPLAPLES